MIKCINDNILVKHIPHTYETKLFIPPEFQKKKHHLQYGKVISCGTGTDLLPMPVKPGNIIVYEKYAGFEVDIDGENFIVLKSFNIICAK